MDDDIAVDGIADLDVVLVVESVVIVDLPVDVVDRVVVVVVVEVGLGLVEVVVLVVVLVMLDVIELLSEEKINKHD